MREPSETTNFPETKQIEMWRGEFGSQYSERNLYSPADLDNLYQRYYGITRTALNQRFWRISPEPHRSLKSGATSGTS